MIERAVFTAEMVAVDQCDKHDRAAERHRQWLSEYRWDLPAGTAYIPPEYDDPMQWAGLLAWAYHDWRYRYHWSAADDLRRFGKPHYCPPCGDAWAEGWQARLCRDHAWAEDGYAWCMRSARELRQRGKR